MATIYSSRSNKPHGVGRLGFGGAGLNLDMAALAGETDLITTFDDFNDHMSVTTWLLASGADGTTNLWEESGWVMNDDGTGTPTAPTIAMNDPTVVADAFQSCIRIFPGTADDSGGIMQLDGINDANNGLAEIGSATTDTVVGGHRSFPHIWIPESGGDAAILDNTVIVFACRIGLQADITPDSGIWEGKVYIGFAASAAVPTIMDHDTGVLPNAAGNLHGFHVGEDGSIRGISKRITADSLVSGTNFTELFAAGSADGSIANGANAVGDIMWFDLALRMNITNMSDDAANGTTTFFSRRVPRVGGTVAITGAVAPGLRETQASNSSLVTSDDWSEHATVLNNETPNHSLALVPAIEVMNGPTGTLDPVFFLDWWSFGISRFSRR